MEKKAQLGDLQGIIITLVVVGIVLGIGFLVLESFQGTLQTSTAVTNESTTVTGVTTLKYNTTNIDCYELVSIDKVMNQTGSIVMSPVNYTIVDKSLGTITNLSTTIGSPLGTWMVGYTYKSGANSNRDSCAGIESTVTATKTIPTWLTIIVILLIVGILLAIVFRSFQTGGTKGMSAEV